VFINIDLDTGKTASKEFIILLSKWYRQHVFSAVVSACTIFPLMSRAYNNF